MPIAGVFIKQKTGYIASDAADAFIKIEGHYLAIDQPSLLIKANGVYNAGSGEAPVNTVLPDLTGTPVVGETLTVTPGTWTGVPTPTIKYRWYADGLPIMGENGPTHVITDQDAGHTITAYEIATNTSGSVSVQATGDATIPPLTGFSSGFSNGFR